MNGNVLGIKLVIPDKLFALIFDQHDKLADSFCWCCRSEKYFYAYFFELLFSMWKTLCFYAFTNLKWSTFLMHPVVQTLNFSCPEAKDLWSLFELICICLGT